MNNPLVSVIVPTYNNAKLITKCVNSILNQNFNKFELILVDDCSKDNTLDILKKFKDKRLKLLKTPKNSGSALARNIGIDNSKGKYIFFIDGDCIASQNWIKEGLRIFKKERCLGVEGKIYYVSKNYKPTASDDTVYVNKGGGFLTGNIAYTKEILKKVNGFDKNLIRMQDRDLGLKVSKHGKISFSSKMIVTHQKFYLTFKKKIKLAKECTKTRVLLFKRFGDRSNIYLRIYNPINLFAIFFPPAVLGALFLHKYKTIEDFKTLFWIYPVIFIERISLWKNAIKERVFLI